MNTFLANQEMSPDSNEIQVRIETLKDKFEAIYQINIEVIEVIESEPTQENEHTEQLYNLEEAYFSTLAKPRALIQKQNLTNQTITNERINQDLKSSMLPQVKLPEMPLPTFDGQIENGLPFRDNFLSQIGNNTKLTEIDKIHYLKSSLSGRASRAIEAIESIEGNYTIAWEILKDKFEDVRKTILKH